MHPLTGRRVLITGAGRGLGRALAQHFAAAGADVVTTDRDAAGVDYPLDVTDAGQIADVRRRVLAESGPPDVLVNNAGVVFGGAFLDVPTDRHATTVAVNLTGLVAVTHAFLGDLLARPAAH